MKRAIFARFFIFLTIDNTVRRYEKFTLSNLILRFFIRDKITYIRH